MEIIDFSQCEQISSDIDGNARKTRIIYNNEIYIMKFGDSLSKFNDNPIASSYNHAPISEHICCNIAKGIGLNAQDTLLGKFKDREVVACKDFIWNGNKNNILIQFGSIEREVIDSNKRGKTPKLHNINEVINNHPFFDGVRDIVRNNYWNTFIFDAIIGNYDRHCGNWGYISTLSSNDPIKYSFYSPAPIYDCGSSLAAWLTEEAMEGIFNNEIKLKERALSWPKASLIVNGKHKIGYAELLNSEYGVEARNALLRLSNGIANLDIDAIVDNTPGISTTRKNFYKSMIYSRIEYILEPVLECACKESNVDTLPSILPRKPIYFDDDSCSLRL